MLSQCRDLPRLIVRGKRKEPPGDFASCFFTFVIRSYRPTQLSNFLFTPKASPGLASTKTNSRHHAAAGRDEVAVVLQFQTRMAVDVLVGVFCVCLVCQVRYTAIVCMVGAVHPDGLVRPFY